MDPFTIHDYNSILTLEVIFDLPLIWQRDLFKFFPSLWEHFQIIIAKNFSYKIMKYKLLPWSIVF